MLQKFIIIYLVFKFKLTVLKKASKKNQCNKIENLEAENGQRVKKGSKIKRTQQKRGVRARTLFHVALN